MLIHFHSSIHKGEIPGDHPMAFGSFAHELINNMLVPKFIEFLCELFRKYYL